MKRKESEAAGMFEKAATLHMDNMAWEYHLEEDAGSFWAKHRLQRGLGAVKKEVVLLLFDS